MDAKNNTLLKGGLPMSTSDFVDPNKARESKLQLLSAISHINEIHAEKMRTSDNSDSLNKTAVATTIDQLNSEFKMDDYIFSNEIVRGDAQSQPTFQNTDEPIMIENFETPNNDPLDFEHPEAQEFGELNVEDYDGENSGNNGDMNNMSVNQGSPMIVLNDDQVGHSQKAGKSKDNKKKSTPSDIKSGRKVAWLSYILFFIPLLFMRNNSFVRHHANEGLELNIMDVLAVAFIFVPKFIKATNHWVELALLISTIIGIVLIALSVITKLFLIIFTLAGKEASSPWFGKTKMIKK